MDDLCRGFKSLHLAKREHHAEPIWLSAPLFRQFRGKQPSKPPSALERFTFAVKPVRTTVFKPAQGALLQSYAVLYNHYDKATSKSLNSPPEPSDDSLFFAVADVKSNIQDYAKFCVDGNKLVVEPFSRALVLFRVKSASRDSKLYKFKSAASVKVARLNARQAKARSVRKKIILQPRDDDPMIIEMRERANIAAEEGAFSHRTDNPGEMVGYPGFRPYSWRYCVSLYSGRTSKRKFDWPHHAAGSLLAPYEFDLLEAKVCGGHKSKRLCNRHGHAPRIPSKQIVFEFLDGMDKRFSWFSDFLLSTTYGVDFMKSIPRTLTKFTCFGRLPRELQNTIWEHALPSRRITVLRSNPVEGLFKPGVSMLDVQMRNGFLWAGYTDPGSIHSLMTDPETKEFFLQCRLEYLADAESRLISDRTTKISNPDEFKALVKEEHRMFEEYFEETAKSWEFYQNVWRMASLYSYRGSFRERVAPFDAVSALLQTCKASRQQVLLNYKAAFGTLNGSKQYCNYENDAVYAHFSGYTNWRATATRNLLPSKTRLFKKRAELERAMLQDCSKVQHLVIRSHLLYPEYSSFYDGADWKPYFIDLATRFPNIKRLTLETSEDFDMDVPKTWDHSTRSCNLQRWLGDAWFEHLPCSAEMTFRSEVEQMNQRLGEFFSEFPQWQPITEFRQVASRREDESVRTPDGTFIQWGYYLASIFAMSREWVDEDNFMRPRSVF